MYSQSSHSHRFNKHVLDLASERARNFTLWIICTCLKKFAIFQKLIMSGNQTCHFFRSHENMLKTSIDSSAFRITRWMIFMKSISNTSVLLRYSLCAESRRACEFFLVWYIYLFINYVLWNL